MSDLEDIQVQRVDVDGTETITLSEFLDINADTERVLHMADELRECEPGEAVNLGFQMWERVR